MVSLLKNQLAKLIYYVRGGVHRALFLGVKVGKNCRITNVNFGTEPFLITIGDNVTITEGVVFLTHDGSSWLIRDVRGRRYQYGRINIGSNVFIGVRSIIMPGVTIQDNVIIAAGTVVTKSVPSDSIVAGNPGKIIASFSTYKEKGLNGMVSNSEVDKNLNYKKRIEALAKFYTTKPYLDRI